MSCLFKCGACCFVLSIWAVVQLTIMGLLYKIEATNLLHDVEPHTYEDLDDFLKTTRYNYHATAINCWITAGLYLAMIAVSYLCIVKARQKAKRLAKMEEDDEVFCMSREKKMKPV